MRIWIKNTEGNPDAALTFALVAFIVVIFKLMLNGAELIVGDMTYTLGTIDAEHVAAILTPTLGAYVGRRYTDKRFNSTLKAAQVPTSVQSSVVERSHEG